MGTSDWKHRVIDDLRNALTQAASTFRAYQQLHLAKPDHVKAQKNAAMAQLCEAALARADAEYSHCAGAPEEGWLIEHADSGAEYPMYWAGNNRWTNGHAGAIRFAREADAAAVAKCETPANSGQPHRVAFHQWG